MTQANLNFEIPSNAAGLQLTRLAMSEGVMKFFPFQPKMYSNLPLTRIQAAFDEAGKLGYVGPFDRATEFMISEPPAYFCLVLDASGSKLGKVELARAPYDRMRYRLATKRLRPAT